MIANTNITTGTPSQPAIPTTPFQSASLYVGELHPEVTEVC